MKRTVCGALLMVASAWAQVVPLTEGPGADTEAVWSPSGREIVFQREQNGQADLLVLDVETGKVRDLVCGPGDARYPCWSPDGSTIVYSYGHITTTANQGVTNGYNLFSVAASGGQPKRLTSGQVRDYTPAFSPDGKTLYFATTRGLEQNDAALHAMNFATREMRSVIRFGSSNMGAVSPSVSPDGRLLAYAMQQGLRTNWAIALASASDPGMRAVLGEQEWSIYAPRWSPDGKLLGCTGYCVGDPGWGVYLIRIPDGAVARLATGEGNSRSPAWSPDGKSLVFENNRTGTYKLYRMPVGTPTFEPARRQLAPQPAKPVLQMDLSQTADGRLPDATGRRHDATVTESLPLTADGSVQCGKGFGRVEAHEDFAFGRQAFYVRAEVFIQSNPKKLQMIVMGDYPQHRLGWQLYVDPKGKGVFNSRDPAGIYVGARTPNPLPVGKRVTLIGVRDARGDVSLIARGSVACDSVATGATMSYGPPNQIRIGSQYHGGDRFQGRLYSVEIGTGVPPEKRRTMLTVEEVMGE